MFSYVCNVFWNYCEYIQRRILAYIVDIADFSSETEFFI